MLSGRALLYRLYQQHLKRQISADELPHHVAMIVDGNRRWARSREDEGFGYRAGAAKILEFLGWCEDIGVKVVTLYLLSNDNARLRPRAELDELCSVISQLADELSLHPTRRVMHVGRSIGLPSQLSESLRRAQEVSASRTGLHVNLAVGYGGRAEIADAMRSIVVAHQASGAPPEDLADLLTPDLISEHLYTSGLPDPDLVIRTSGEQRLSDFMLWQSAHSELYFVEALYPDLREVDLLRALRDFGSRHRRFGQ